MKTEIIAIIDRSGSMESIRKDAIGGFNSFLEDQKTVPGEARMTLSIFDDRYDVLYTGKSLDEAEPLTEKTFVPRGGTALRDAIGRTLNARIKEQGWADKVIVCILTDGGENQSREFTQEQIKTMITHAESHGWSFVFLAANQDAFAVGAGYGIAAAGTMSFDSNAIGTQSAYASMSSMTRDLRTGV